MDIVWQLGEIIGCTLRHAQGDIPSTKQIDSRTSAVNANRLCRSPSSRAILKLRQAVDKSCEIRSATYSGVLDLEGSSGGVEEAFGSVPGRRNAEWANVGAP